MKPNGLGTIPLLERTQEKQLSLGSVAAGICLDWRETAKWRGLSGGGGVPGAKMRHIWLLWAISGKAEQGGRKQRQPPGLGLSVSRGGERGSPLSLCSAPSGHTRREQE